MLKEILMTGTTVVGLALSGTAVADSGPSDMQIAHIAYTAGNIDIRYAHLALAKSANPAVRDFAQLMLQDHEAVNDQALALLAKLGATPEDNPTSQKLTAGANQKLNELADLHGANFDRAYAANELAYHKFVNKTVEKTFIPSTDNRELKSLLGEALQVFKIHQNHAVNMVKNLR